MSARRAVGLGLLAAGALAAPSAAQDGAVGETQLRESVETLDVDGSVLAIDLEGSVARLEVERRRGDRVTVTLSADVLFAFDRAELTPGARRTIARVAGRVRSTRAPIRVDGYTDSLGSTAYNLRLSRRRAAAVTQALRDTLPDGTRIVAAGHGEGDPVAPNTQGGRDDPAGRAENRRVTVAYARR